MPSAIETHPQREKILSAILAGEPPKKIAAWVQPRINQTTIWRYRRDKVAPAMRQQVSAVKFLEERGLLPKGEGAMAAVQAAEDATRASLQSDPIRAHMAARIADRQRILEACEEKQDFRGWAAVDRNDISTWELQARLDGLLDSARPASVEVRMVVLPCASQAPAQIAAEDVEFRQIEGPAENPPVSGTTDPPKQST